MARAQSYKKPANAAANANDIVIRTQQLSSAGTLLSGVLGTPASSVVDGRQAVTTAGTRVQLSSQACRSVIITASTANTGIITVGGSTVVAAVATRRGTPLNAGEDLVVDVDNLADLWIDSTVNGEAITYLCLVA